MLDEGAFEKGFAARMGPVVAQPEVFEWAMALAHDPDPKIAFRASYALEEAFFGAPERYLDYTPRITDNFLRVINASAQRHYAKIMAWLLRYHPDQIVPSNDERIAERAFDLLIGDKTPVATRVWAMDMLEVLAGRLPWVAEQLGDTIKHLMAEGSPGFINRGRKVCRSLENRKNNKKSY